MYMVLWETVVNHSPVFCTETLQSVSSLEPADLMWHHILYNSYISYIVHIISEDMAASTTSSAHAITKKLVNTALSNRI